ncbi:MFS transporter [bacterium]|nr:MFS transporter [bacterium]
MTTPPRQPDPSIAETGRVAAVPQEVTGQPRRVVVGRVSLAATFRALRHRNFRLFFCGQLVSLIGTWMDATAKGWLVYQLTGSKVLLGVVAAASSFPLLLFSMWGGSVADRWPKRSVLVVTQLAMMIPALALAVLVATGLVRPWHVVALAAATGLAMAFDIPCRQAFVVEMTSKDDLMNAISLNSSVFNGARVIGPALAGWLMAWAGLSVCFLINGLSYLAVIAGLLAMRLPPHVPPAQPVSTWRHAAEGLRYVGQHRGVRGLLLLLAVVGVFGWSYSVLMPAFARDVIHVGERGFGLLLSANGFGALVGALVVATLGGRLAVRLILVGGLSLFAVMLLALAWAPGLTTAMLALALGGLGLMMFFATSNTVVQTSVTDEMRGRVMGVWVLVFGGMTPIGSLIAGSLAQSFGVSIAITIGAVVCAGAVAVAHAILRSGPRRLGSAA